MSATITFDTLASKQDIRNLEQKLLDIEYRLTIRLGFIIATSIAIIAAIIKLIRK